MRIALVKPDWRIRGGFEKVLDRISVDLSAADHSVELVQLDVPTCSHRPFGEEVPDEVWSRSPEWFTHLSMLQAFRELELSWADLVISTQPPSYAVRHPRQLALFYHHARAFYDLEDVWIGAGLAPELLHRTASALLRQAEAEDFQSVGHFLAGSQRVAERLRRYQGPDLPISLYQAAGPAVLNTGDSAFEHVLCVSRHEFTKRTELAVLGLAMSESGSGVLAGAGGRLPFVREFAGRLAAGSIDPLALTDEDIWLNLGQPTGTEPPAEHPGIAIRGRVSDRELDRLYRDALCVLAPAYDEDDGLTVLEAMAYGKPVIVCRDGGGLTALVRDGVNGFVVDPDGASIAAAVDRLTGDPELARRLGEAGRDTAAGRTPANARNQLLTAVQEVAGTRR